MYSEKSVNSRLEVRELGKGGSIAASPSQKSLVVGRIELTMLSLFCVLSFFICFAKAFSNELLVSVSSTGTDSKPCGQKDQNPCATISFALTSNPEATSVTFPQDSITDDYIAVSSMFSLLNVFVFFFSRTIIYYWIELL